MVSIKKVVDDVILDYQSLTKQKCFYINKEEIIRECCDLVSYNPFCKSITNNEVGRYLCQKKRNVVLNNAILYKKPHYSFCHAGIVVAAVPVISEDEIQGVLLCFFLTDESKSNILLHKEHYLTKFNIEANHFNNSIPSFTSIPEHKLDAMVTLLDSLIRMNLKESNKTRKEEQSPFLNDDLEPEDISSNKTGYIETPITDKTVGGTFSLYPYLRPKMRLFIDESNINSAEGFLATLEVTEKKIKSLYYDIRAGHLLEAKERYKSLFQYFILQDEFDFIRTNVFITSFSIYRIFMIHQSYFHQMQELFYKFYKKASLVEDIVSLRDAVSDLYDGLIEIYSLDKQNINPIVNRIKEYLEENYQHTVNLGSLAKINKISVSYASRQFKKQMGISAQAYLNEIRMDNAQRLLCDTDMPIKDVAKCVGYDDVRNFYKMFSKHFSITCTQMRNFSNKPKLLNESQNNQNVHQKDTF